MTEESLAEGPTEFWERRHELTPQATTDTDIEERAENGGRHLVILADIADEDILSQFESELSGLDRFDCIAAVPLQYVHVTVKVMGNVVSEPRNEADLIAEDEGRIVAAAGSVFSDIEPFTVDFPQLNLFPTTVYAEVADDGRFSELNRRICDVPEIPVRNRDGQGFIPHATLGQFVSDREYKRLIEYIEANRHIDIGPIEVSEIELVALDLTTRFPAFETVETFDLG
jgi:2'-5' RNA ligase